MKKEKIGCFSEKIIKALQLDIQVGTPIYIADSNLKHMKDSHPADFKKYSPDIKNILANPDYVGKNSKDKSIEFIKEYLVADEYVKVAVRVSSRNVYYARSLYVLNTKRVQNFIAKKTLIKLDNT